MPTPDSSDAIYPTPFERWGVPSFSEWVDTTQVYELVHSSRVVVEPEKPIPAPVPVTESI